MRKRGGWLRQQLRDATQVLSHSQLCMQYTSACKTDNTYNFERLRFCSWERESLLMHQVQRCSTHAQGLQGL